MSQNIHPIAGIPVAPPPWTLLAESWLFLGYHSGSEIKTIKSHPLSEEAISFSANASIEQKTGLRAGSYHPMEVLPETLDPDNSPGLKIDEFNGGLCGWILYRYSESPVGPYDELIYVAGSFSSPETSTSGLRITNIVVSTEATMVSGRANWNIPKHLARFKWSHPVHSDFKGTQTVEVYHPETSPLHSSNPFFSAKLSQSAFPALPVNTNLFFFPSLPLFQPDLRQSSRYTEERSRKSGVETERGIYKSTAPTFKGSFNVAYAEPVSKDGYGDGKSFPKEKTFSTGVHFKKVQVTFPCSKEHVAASKANL